MPAEGRRSRVYKVVIVGYGGSGKSDLANTFTHGYCVEGENPTIEDTYMKTVVVDNESALIDVLDTSGQEEYAAMREQYLHTGEGFILVYSITSRESFEEIDTFHRQILQAKKRDSVPMVLVGNKCHLAHERQVDMGEGRDLAKRLGCGFVEASSRHLTTINEAFDSIIRKIRKCDKKQEDIRAAEELSAAEKANRKPGKFLTKILAKFRLKPKE